MDEISGKIIIHDKNKIYTREHRKIVKSQKQEKKLCVKTK
jgi:hypothetical protein